MEEPTEIFTTNKQRQKQPGRSFRRQPLEDFREVSALRKKNPAKTEEDTRPEPDTIRKLLLQKL